MLDPLRIDEKRKQLSSLKLNAERDEKNAIGLNSGSVKRWTEDYVQRKEPISKEKTRLEERSFVGTSKAAFNLRRVGGCRCDVTKDSSLLSVANLLGGVHWREIGLIGFAESSVKLSLRCFNIHRRLETHLNSNVNLLRFCFVSLNKLLLI
ncbi:hypothetical protein NPIL_437211 [Nephila pilipes]|uniref:Uncharacterized protein n=1 Tax=Nephila pilipes TaxID=299642 RepID=A0A8X6QA44_NEPPI|nr:hypothetical protein NPIL_437211 [Nephila pilipes]